MSTDTEFRWGSYVSPIQYDNRKDIKVGDLLRMKAIRYEANKEYDNAIVKVIGIRSPMYTYDIEIIEIKSKANLPSVTSWAIDNEIWGFEFVVDEWDK